MEHYTITIEHCDKTMKHCDVTLEHCDITVEHCNVKIENCVKTMEHCDVMPRQHGNCSSSEQGTSGLTHNTTSGSADKPLFHFLTQYI